MRNQSSITGKLYRDVIEDVIGNLSEDFTDNGVDDDVRQFLKKIWTEKVADRKVMDPVDNPGEASQSNCSQLARPWTSSRKQWTGVTQPDVISIRINSTHSSNHYDVKIPTSAVKNGVPSAQLAKALNSPEVARLLCQSLTKESMTAMLQQIIDKALFSVAGEDIIQIDGHYMTDSEEDEEEDQESGLESEEDEEEDESSDEVAKGPIIGKEYALDSSDDVEEEDLLDSDNIVVCQYAEIKRDRNHWKLQLKDGVMNINGRDYIFNQILGQAYW